MLSTSTFNNGYLPTAILGCHLFGPKEKWYLGIEDLPSDVDWSEQQMPEIAVDPASGVISMVNVKDVAQSFTLSVRGDAASRAHGRNGKRLTYSKGESDSENCITFIAILKPYSLLDLCTVEDVDWDGIDIDSDIQFHTPHPCPETPPLPHHSNLHFPLGGDDGPYCCTQGEGSLFTHHFAGNHHAVDFRCPVGTPVLSVCDGIVVEVSDSNTTSGIHVSFLYKWNSITIQLSSGGFAEYVHLHPSSSLVKIGDSVSRGQQIALSGEIGFCPEPHLHFQILESQDKKSITLPVRFGDDSFKPVVGLFYDSSGEINS